MPPIVLEQVCKTYPNGFVAVKDLSLSVAEGEFMVMVGPSGCGKTTALRMVAGLEEITSGTLKIGDKVANNMSSKARDIAMVFQNYALYPHMSVADNIAFALQLRRVPKAEVKRKVADAAEILGLTAWLGEKPGQLSGGQRQRVAMGRAIVREPAVFLMDEPLSNLDAKLRVQMRAEVSRIQRRIGVATLYVTHDQTEAMTMGDRVAVLRAGRLQQCDYPQRLYNEPVNMFVAAFIGSPPMNLFEGVLSQDGSSVQLGTQSVELSEQVRHSHPALARYYGRTVVVGIRPEDLPAAEGEEGTAAVLKGDVVLVEALGAEMLVHFTIDSRRVHVTDAEETDLLETSAVTLSGEGVARVSPRAIVALGERVAFTVHPDRLHFFDVESQLAITSATESLDVVSQA